MNNIPIENIYYIIFYAFKKLNTNGFSELNLNKNIPNNSKDLFAHILLELLNNLIKKGFYFEYKSYFDNLKNIKGKINFNATVKNIYNGNMSINCEYSEFDFNNKENQIIKAILNYLINKCDIEKNIKIKLALIYKYFNNAENVKLSESLFTEIKINKLNSNYDIILNICKIIYFNLFIEEKKGITKFINFLITEKNMPYIFEEFIRNFYYFEQKDFKVKREYISWNIDECFEGNINLLPKMITDITLENDNQKIIIDAKYYKETLVENFDVYKFKTSNLYQIYSYLMNVKTKQNQKLTGILIYPQNGYEIDASYRLNNLILNIKTIDLSQNWIDIKKRLLDLI